MTDPSVKASREAARAASLRAKQAKLSYRIAKVENRQSRFNDAAGLKARGLRKNWLGKVVPVKGTETVQGPRRSFWRRLGNGHKEEEAHVGDERIEDATAPNPQADEVNGGAP
jgi:hypothetical protein